MTAHHVRTKTSARPDLEVATGAIVGAAAGAIGGPAGAVIGAGVRTAPAMLAHEAAATEQTLRAEHGRGLDDDRAPGFAEPPAWSTWLRADHDDLDTLTRRALAIVEDGDRDDVRALIADIEARLTAHMDSEERELLPRYAKEHPDDARALLDSHADFRRLFAELGVAGDLHLVRLDRVRELANALKKHARRENEGLYRWAASSTERI